MTIADNVAGRKAAEECFGLLSEYLQECELTPEGQGNAWGHLAEMLNDVIGKKESPQECLYCRDRLSPLGDKAVALFERKRMPWGKHKDEPIGGIPLSYLDYIVRQQEEDPIRRDLPRYLRSKMVVSEARLFEDDDA